MAGSSSRSRPGVAQLSFWFPHANGFCAKSSARDDIDLAVVWDDDVDRGAERAKFFGCDFEPDLDRLLARDDVQAVSLCAEPSRQPELAAAAAAAGMDMVIEKAMAGSLAGARRIVEAVQRHEVRMLPAFNLRWQPAAQLVHELVHSGAVGRVSRVRRLHGHYTYAEGSGFDYAQLQAREGWGDAEAEQRGSLYYVGTHASLWYVWMFGVPTSVTAMGTTAINGMPVEDNSVALFRYPPGFSPGLTDGFVAVLECSETLAASQTVTEVYGTAGTILQHRGSMPSTRVWNPSPTPVSVYETATGAWRYPAVPPHFVRHESHYSAFDVFLDALVTDRPMPMDEVDGYHSISMVVAAEEAMRTGRETAVHHWGQP